MVIPQVTLSLACEYLCKEGSLSPDLNAPRRVATYLISDNLVTETLKRLECKKQHQALKEQERAAAEKAAALDRKAIKKRELKAITMNAKDVKKLRGPVTTASTTAAASKSQPTITNFFGKNRDSENVPPLSNVTNKDTAVKHISNVKSFSSAPSVPVFDIKEIIQLPPPSTSVHVARSTHQLDSDFGGCNGDSTSTGNYLTGSSGSSIATSSTIGMSSTMGVHTSTLAGSQVLIKMTDKAHGATAELAIPTINSVDAMIADEVGRFVMLGFSEHGDVLSVGDIMDAVTAADAKHSGTGGTIHESQVRSVLQELARTNKIMMEDDLVYQV
eukprot:CAMPEP_0174972542 /NCGR_PEP_ID=MMETSP0004_2-20121128/10688_1 /TAXON_ID=420556 /ORGANISM="Ochromonas sp., Strain CCMP1393" /LENGTH=329 /DNA_ID=CAMNT_0016222779 /DNA_START=238 /DNA_END=1227 /DNA_ORIENTATION=-